MKKDQETIDFKIKESLSPIAQLKVPYPLRSLLRKTV